MATNYDETGKLNLSDIYNNADPIQYFSVLGQLEYRIPEMVKPVFEQVIAARREMSGERCVKVVDIGCSYGINAALLRYDLSMGDLDAHYEQAGMRSRPDLVEQDAAFFADPADPDLEVIGIDTAERALTYAVEAGLLDAAISTDLESEDMSARDAALLANTDLVISTGCFGYITERTLETILAASGGSHPWMAHSVLRMFDFDGAAEALSGHGYVTEKLDGLVPQRRFATETERDNVLSRLADAGVDPSGFEDEGTYFAEVFVSRPAADAAALPLSAIIDRPACLPAVA
jgi:predicted TPR repeat methyltransferase